MCEKLVKLCHVADLALMFERKIAWRVFRQLLVHDNQLDSPLDFYREAFTYGLELRRVFEPWEPNDPIFMRIWRKAFWSADRLLVTLSTNNHQIKFRIPEKQQKWYGRLLSRDECLFKSNVIRRSGRNLALRTDGDTAE